MEIRFHLCVSAALDTKKMKYKNRVRVFDFVFDKFSARMVNFLLLTKESFSIENFLRH